MKTIDDNTLAKSIKKVRNIFLSGFITVLTLSNALSYYNTNQLIQDKTLTPQQIKDNSIVKLLTKYNSNFYQKRMNLNCDGIGYLGSQLAAENAQSKQFWEQRKEIEGGDK
jgi:hypothetical protein